MKKIKFKINEKFAKQFKKKVPGTELLFLILIQFLVIVSTLTGSSPSPCGRVKFSARKFWEGVRKKVPSYFL
jgi:hypothetical protein